MKCDDMFINVQSDEHISYQSDVHKDKNIVHELDIQTYAIQME